MVGIIEPPPPPKPRDGDGLTPGYWKNHSDKFPVNPFLSYEKVFEVTLSKGDPSLLDALNAKGGGEAALLRSSTAAYLNALTFGDSFNFSSEASLKNGVTEAFNLDPNAANYADQVAAAISQIRPILEKIDLFDTNADVISEEEVRYAVQDAYSAGGLFEPSDIRDLALAFDVLNNMGTEAGEIGF